MNLRILITPVMGAIIGYVTNKIAVKMLFRPLKPVKIGNFTLPFTPGIIPKERDRIADTIGQTITRELLTEDLIINSFLSEDTLASLDKVVDAAIYKIINSDKDIRGYALGVLSEEEFASVNDKCTDFVTDRIHASLIKMNIGDIFKAKAGEVISEKLGGSMLSFVIKPETISPILDSIRDSINKYVEEESREKIEEAVDGEIHKLETMPLRDGLTEVYSYVPRVKEIVRGLYIDMVKKHLGDVLRSLSIDTLVADKIKDMDLMDLERLILSVMEKELGAIVNLGAVIGLILGIINVLITYI